VSAVNQIFKPLQNYFLFIDTETSGLPKNWKAPYHQEGNWPSIIQIAWIIYDKNFNEVERQNHYIVNDGFIIEKSSQEIHGITAEFLNVNGKSKEAAMMPLLQVIKKFSPAIIGHYMEFDYHMINAEFCRMGISNPLEHQVFYCTMKASKPYVRNPRVDLLKLNEFYEELFNEKPKDFHNALSDALNTAKIFFHLFKENENIHEAIINQKSNFSPILDDTKPNRSLINRIFSI